MQIRFENEHDYAAIDAVNRAAFDTPLEARLVNVLRQQAHPLISLVAEDDGEIVGHILFSPVVVDGQENVKIMGLGPMAVVPPRQRQGIGSALVRAGLDECRQAGFGAVVVLGHPTYYPKFGFVPSTRFGMRSEYEAPEDAFMVLELKPGYLGGAGGTVRYHEAFNGIEDDSS